MLQSITLAAENVESSNIVIDSEMIMRVVLFIRFEFVLAIVIMLMFSRELKFKLIYTHYKLIP